MMFSRPGESHEHSLQTLNMLYEHDDFMESIATVVDLGCGSGEDIEWWATRTIREEPFIPLNIRCVAVDQFETLKIAKKYSNLTYQSTNFEEQVSAPPEKFDILWCHDSFQYAINPLETLNKWWHIASDGAMLAIILPQTTNFHQKKQHFVQSSGCYYHYTLVNLMHMLAVNGWDCREGFFLKKPNDLWLHAIVYKSEHKPMDPKVTTLFELADKKLLPESAVASINAHGYINQSDLVLPWLDKGLNWMGHQ